MKIKKYMVIVSIFFLSLYIVSAQVLDGEIVTQEDIKEAGVTPDQRFLWGIEMAFNRITEFFSENARLKHSKERLAEVKVMLAENKPEHVQRAIEKFDKTYNRLKNKTDAFEGRRLIDNLGQRVSAIASRKGSLNETDRLLIKDLIAEHRENIKKKFEELRRLNITNEFISNKILKNENRKI